MCLILFAYKAHPRYPLILAANRDEFYDRPTTRAHFWEDHPGLLAGRDMKYGGTWMGITRSGRFSAVTNFRDRTEFREHPLSRGLMVRDYLIGREPPEVFVEGIIPREEEYNGFNLLAADQSNFAYYSNRRHKVMLLEPGIYSLSNHLLDTPWPKVVRSRQAFAGIVKGPDTLIPDQLFEILLDRTAAGDGELPDTGFDVEWERILSPPFIVSPIYGTRASTVLFLDTEGKITFTERSFDGPEDPGSTRYHEFTLTAT